MKRLILIRHAKSDWGAPELEDRDRPLNPRGRRSASAVGAWLRDQGYRPQAALVSTAVRARETWDGIAAELPDHAAEVSHLHRLYHAAPDGILARIAEAAASPLAVVGHNPGFADLAVRLVAGRPALPDLARFPTCATLVLDFDIDDWAGIGFGQGRVVDFVVPRELTD